MSPFTPTSTQCYGHEAGRLGGGEAEDQRVASRPLKASLLIPTPSSSGGEASFVYREKERARARERDGRDGEG